jgi:hypothetical protein
VSAGVIPGLIWIGFVSHRPRTVAVIAALVERIPIPRHPAIEGPSRMASSAGPNVVCIVGDKVGCRDIACCAGPSPRGAAPGSSR